MIKLGVNTVLFKGYTFREAAEAIKKAGYDGLEISAIKGMCEHLNLDDWKSQKNEIKSIMEEFNLEMLSTEVASLDEERLMKAFEAGAEIGIPVINIGPGGKSDDEDSLKATLDTISKMSEKASDFGVILCVKAHVGASIYNTPTTLKAMDYIKSPSFGIDMDPSHIYRSGEFPEEALPKVIKRVKHIHIRDCKGRGPSPGEPSLQACGRGDINLFGYFKAMVDAKYEGPVCLEVIGPEQDMVSASIIAAESYGYMNACLKILGAR
ncbi:MAG: sugar phosphate isomerase/epimerase [Clostridiaceae bacterium]|jgi:sugar phosphate isomerase/epimerase|nr:sugar phosphate isomerase/epimerase [Clostridiaceae bacterium]